MIGYLAVGIAAGLVAFVLALGLGASFGLALVSYALGGIGTMVMLAGLMLVRRPHALPHHAIPDAPTSRAVARDAARVGLRILAVDDDPFIRELLPKIAARVGCSDVTLASSGQQALDRIATAAEPFDCLLLDINMPDLSGIELCAHHHADGIDRHGPSGPRLSGGGVGLRVQTL